MQMMIFSGAARGFGAPTEKKTKIRVRKKTKKNNKKKKEGRKGRRKERKKMRGSQNEEGLQAVFKLTFQPFN